MVSPSRDTMLDVLQKAGLDPKYSPHKLRHTVASELYQATKDQVMVAQQLGQKGTSATDLYTHVDQREQRAALNASAKQNKSSSD